MWILQLWRPLVVLWTYPATSLYRHFASLSIFARCRYSIWRRRISCGSHVDFARFGPNFNPLDSKGNYSATLNNTKLVHWPLMGGLLHLVQRGGAWAGCGPAQSPPSCTKRNSFPAILLTNKQSYKHRRPKTVSRPLSQGKVAMNVLVVWLFRRTST